MKKIAKTPPGSLVRLLDDSNELKGKIEFKHKRSTKPLPPLVETIMETDTENLLISVIVFLDSTIELPEFKVYQYFTIGDDGEPELQFFLQYNHKETTTREFNAYEINFYAEIDNMGGYALSAFDSIETFLWDSDPVSSRGTVTNIQPN